MATRDESLDAVKGFAIILVFLGHCLVWNNMAATDPYIYDFIKSVQMPLFMAVSGYLAGMGSKKRSTLELLLLIKKRAVSYLVPFFIWPVLLHPTHPIREIKGILWQPDKGLWFLLTLFVVTCVTLIARQIAGLFKKVEWLIFIICVMLFYLLFFIQGRNGFTLFGPSLTLSYMPYYVVCYFLTAYILPAAKYKPKRKQLSFLWAASGCVFIAFIVLFDLQRM